MLHKLQLGVRIGLNYLKLRYRNFRRRGKGQPGMKTLFVNLNDRRLGPYYFALIFSFHEKGYNILMKNNFLFIGNCLKADANLFKLPRLKVIDFYPRDRKQKQIIYLSDRKAKYSKGSWKKELIVDCDVYGEKTENKKWLTMPFPMNPTQYISGNFKEIEKFRTAKKEMRVFFSGNQDKEAYSHPRINNFFGKLNRVEIVHILLSELREDEKLVIEEKSQFLKVHDTYQNKFILNRWNWSNLSYSNLGIRVKNESWLRTIAKSHFFLAPPGIRMPLCFNIVEAMAAGTIPITEYPEFLDPPLEHMKNCIVFSGKDDLVKKMRMVFNMEANLIEKLAKQAAEYYDKYLYPTRLPTEIEAISEKEIQLYVNAEEASYQDYLVNKKWK